MIKQHLYKAYLVRVWPIKSGRQLIWRASVESIQTDEYRYFATLEGLFAYLWQQSEEEDRLHINEERGDAIRLEDDLFLNT